LKVQINVFAIVVVLVTGFSPIFCCDAFSEGKEESPSTHYERLFGQFVAHKVALESFKLSPDNRRFAYLDFDKNSKQCLVVDGKQQGGKYDSYGIDNIVFSPDSKRVAYGAMEWFEPPQEERRKGKQVVSQQTMFCIVVDGKKGKHYRNIGAVEVFSPDSRHIAYRAQVDSQWCIVYDGKEGKTYKQVGDPVFSPDNAHFAYEAQIGSQACIVLDGKEGKLYDDVTDPIFNADSKLLGYSAKRAGKWYTVIGEAEGKAYNRVWGLIFGPKGHRVAYWANEDGSWVAVIDGNKGHTSYQSVTAFAFSPDSNHIAFGVKVGNNWRVVVDGKEGKLYDDVRKPIFSPDSKHVAYAAKKGDSWLVIKDGYEGRAYSEVKHLVFSPDSKHLIYEAYDDEAAKEFIVVDGQEGKKYDVVIFEQAGGQIIFDSPDQIRYIVLRQTRKIKGFPILLLLSVSQTIK